MTDVKEKEAKKAISEICSNPSLSGDNFPETNNLILIKLQNITYCFTPDEMASILFSYDKPKTRFDISISSEEFSGQQGLELNLPAIIEPPLLRSIPREHKLISPEVKQAVSPARLKQIQERVKSTEEKLNTELDSGFHLQKYRKDSLKDFATIFSKQSNQEYWLYKIPFAEVWVTHSLLDMYKKRVNTMELFKLPQQFKIFRSLGVGSLHDTLVDIYVAKQISRGSVLPDCPADIQDEFEPQPKVKEKVPVSRDKKQYWPNGDIRVHEFYSKWYGEPESKVTYYPGQKIESEENYKNGKLEGWRKKWYKNSELWEQEWYKNGLLEGERKIWYKNGKLAQKEYYKNGEKNGPQTVWNIKGELTQHREYNNGMLMRETSYNKNGELEGERKEWHENGQLWAYGLYKNGKLEGERKMWHENGQLNVQEFYKNGELHGEVQKWDKNGQPTLHIIYTNGVVSHVYAI